MRPKREFIFLVVLLSAVLCKNAELRQTEPSAHIKQSNKIEEIVDPSKFTFNIMFEQFKHIYHKKYSSIAEQNYRKLIFQQNLEELNRHNQNPEKKYRKKPNVFLDVSREEFKSVYTTVRPSDKFSRNVSAEITKKEEDNEKRTHRSHAELTDTTNEQDYSKDSQNQNEMIQTLAREKVKTEWIHQIVRPTRRTLNNLQSESNLLSGIYQRKSVENSIANNPDPISQSKLPQVHKTKFSQTEKIYINWSAYTGQVRYQGYCGACYAFATVDTLAAHLAIYQYDFFVSLSIQQIIDCSFNQLTYGCNGGYLQGALTYIQMYGIVSEGLYPFTSGNNGAANLCKMSGGSFKLSSFKPIQQGSCSSVISQLYRGPVSAGISGYNLRFYDSGIFDDCSARDALDHAVMIMGFQSGKGWRIKNSWGNDWGENGYGWIAEGNTCWICNMTVAIEI